MNTNHNHHPHPDDSSRSPAAGEFAHELLSAAHDRELSTDEQAILAQMLADDPTLQERLDDFQELSTLIQSLARPAAPSTLKTTVLERLQAPTADVPPPRATATQPFASKPINSSPQTRSWLMWGTAIASVATMLLVTMQLSGRFGGNDSLTTVSPSLRPNTVVPEEPFNSRAGGSHVAMDESLLENEVVAETAPALAKGVEAISPLEAADAAPAAPRAMMRNSSPRMASATLEGSAESAENNQLPQIQSTFFPGMVIDPQLPPAIGHEYSTFLTQGELVAQVTARVVGVDTMGDHTLVLMQGNPLKVITGNSEGEAITTLQRRYGVPDDGEFVIILWQAPPDEIANVKLELERIPLDTQANSLVEAPQTADSWTSRQLEVQEMAPLAQNRTNRSTESPASADGINDRPAASTKTIADAKPEVLKSQHSGQRPPSPVLPESELPSSRDRLAKGTPLKSMSKPFGGDGAQSDTGPNAQGSPAPPSIGRKPSSTPIHEKMPSENGLHLEIKGRQDLRSSQMESLGIRLTLTEYQQLQRRLGHLPQSSEIVGKVRSLIEMDTVGTPGLR
ncbi:MAG: hypothetical protein R3C01_08300 [Planctomycetaceae bacterium]